MAGLWEYPELSNYVVEKLKEHVGSFLQHFLGACQSADYENFEILKPVLEQIRKKYPLAGSPREYFCRGCKQLRFDDNRQACGNCGSADLVWGKVGELNSERSIY